MVVLLSNSDCQLGFARNDSSGICEDIDECEDGDVTCNIETQVCFNTPGSYRCLDVEPVTCQDGYRKNPETKQCEGRLKL